VVVLGQAWQQNAREGRPIVSDKISQPNSSATVGASLESPITPGSKFGHYQVTEIVAQSEAFVVFKATDSRDGRQVAIKVPQPHVANDPTFAEWFRREREIAERLDHPGIVKVILDPDAEENFLVMEWFEGKPLRAVLDKEKRLAPGRAVHIAAEICGALEYIHSLGTIHRDLRPENILIGAGDYIKLIDFGGAAKARARRLTITKVAQITGASGYVSPEELRGKQSDARSDIYALGLVLYEMLTGQKAFPQADPYDRLTKYPVPPREIDPIISPQLQEVLYRAIERDPANRYAGAHEFAVDLSNLERVGVTERPEIKMWKKQRTAKWRRILFFAALALVPLIIFGLLTYIARQ